MISASMTMEGYLQVSELSWELDNLHRTTESEQQSNLQTIVFVRLCNLQSPRSYSKWADALTNDFTLNLTLFFNLRLKIRPPIHSLCTSFFFLNLLPFGI
ncbi:hypothetical protein L1987_32307 [Smallanthus sonchifolius]|uniref:Uncharacterized protein n=1 Tax=Smallanthus sonchifolius TaxID=185202 RepID=A0ACB9I820_9ASTR|nr:hypothetical protein L1987_32307 [Smallanthus sonchifolius]